MKTTIIFQLRRYSNQIKTIRTSQNTENNNSIVHKIKLHVHSLDIHVTTSRYFINKCLR